MMMSVFQFAGGASSGNLLAVNFAPIYAAAAVIAVIVFLSVIAFFVIRSVLRSRSLVKTGEATLRTFMITVPKFKTSQDVQGDSTTAQIQEDISIAETFYAALGGLRAQRGWRAGLFGREDALALEIVADEGLITFYMSVPQYMFEFVQQQIHAQYPDASIVEVRDYNIFSPSGTIVGGYLKLKRESVVPIKTYKTLESDPLNSVTNALSKIPQGDGVAVQFMVRSAKASWRDMGHRIVKNMHKGQGYSEARSGSSGATWGKALRDVVLSPAKDNQTSHQEIKQPTQAEQEMLQGIERKLAKAGMDVNIRIVVSSQSPASAQADLNHVIQAFAQYNIYEYGNSFTKAIPSGKKQLVRDFIYRNYNDRYRIVLNTEEMASLWHLPLPSTETPNIRWMEARVAPAPTNIPTSGLHLGFNEYRGVKKDIYMNDEDRARHMYIIGKTGSGKSYFLRYMALQDIKNGKGICVVDPHGDLVDSILGAVPADRIDDVIYFNPADQERPMGLNMLEAPSENMRDFAVQEMISIFYMLFSAEMIGPMFEHNMRNFMLTLMSDEVNPGTIAEVPRIVTDAAFQKTWVDKVKDPVVRSFWLDEMANTSDYHKSEMMGYLVSKVGRFVENALMRNIIGQSRSAFDFRKVMDEGKILLVNLSKGQIGEVNANLLGLIIVSKLQMAAFGRADMPEEDRKDFYLYIDEFQNFITPSIATILSEARKYRLNLILAHQYMGQLTQEGDTKIRDAVLGNVGTMLASRIGPEDTEVLGRVFEPTFTPYDLMNTDKFTWNAKLIVNNSQAKPFTLKTVPPEKSNPELAAELREISRLTYGRPKDLVEREIALRSGFGAQGAGSSVPPQAPPSL